MEVEIKVECRTVLNGGYILLTVEKVESLQIFVYSPFTLEV